MAFASHTQSSVAVVCAVVLVAVAAVMVFVRRLVAVASYSYPFVSASSGDPASYFPVALLDFHSHSDCAVAWG